MVSGTTQWMSNLVRTCKGCGYLVAEEKQNTKCSGKDAENSHLYGHSKRNFVERWDLKVLKGR